jgi:hypothetical protein
MIEQKIAFLFLTLDNPLFPDIWNYYLRGYENYYNIYIHPKYPAKVTWHPENIIKDLKNTEWGLIVEAYLSLFKEAYNDKSNIKFIIISESCIPIKSFDIMYDIVMENVDESFIKLSNISKYDYEVRLSNKIKHKYNNKLIKHYSRMCLSRYHVKKLLTTYNVNDFMDMKVGDEFFLSSIMPIKNNINYAITFDDWDYVIKITNVIKNNIKKLKINGDNESEILNLQNEYNELRKHPKKINIVDKYDLYNMTNTNSLFYRKFDKNSNIRKYIYDFI